MFGQLAEIFAHRLVLELEVVGGVHKSVENGVGEGVVADEVFVFDEQAEALPKQREEASIKRRGNHKEHESLLQDLNGRVQMGVPETG